MRDGSASYRAMLLMVLGAGLLVLNDAAAKYLMESYPVWQVLFVRQFVAVLPIVAYICSIYGWQALRTLDLSGQVVRGLCFIASVWLMMLSLSLLPLPTVTVIAFSSPIFVAALSLSVLRERVGPHTWIAIMFGFIGVLVIVRPFSVTFEWAVLIPMAAALAAGLRDLLTRKLSLKDASFVTLFWSSCLVLISTLPIFAFLRFEPIAIVDVWLFVACGLLNAGSHFLIIEALRHGAAATVAPFRYSALLWSAVIGYLGWGDLVDLWTIVGALVIAASGIYLMRRR